MKNPLHAIILAAGQGTRMRSDRPKVLHELAGKAMLGHVIDAARELGAAGIHIVIGHGAEQVRAWAQAQYGNTAALSWAEQRERLGTGHAVSQALPQVPDDAQVLVLYGDVPLVTADSLHALVAAGRRTLALMTVTLPDPGGYGRILRNRQKLVTGIVEHRDASPRQQAIHEINTGLLSAPAKKLRGWLTKVRNVNASQEFYLTDVVAIAAKAGLKIASVSAQAEEVEGANDRLQLARLERLLQRRQSDALLRAGLALADPSRFDLRGTLHHGRDVQIDVGVVLEGEIELGDGVSIGPYAVLKNVKLGAGTQVLAHSVLEGVRTGRDCRIGPFARIRPDTQLADEVHIGNFVEIKKGQLGRGTKAGHLAYIGDAIVGADVNISAGVITCNYDGANKHVTVIGDGAFIGTDSQLVAPVEIGANAFIAAGSTIAKNAPADQLTINRPRDQRSLAGWKRPVKKPK